MTYVEKMYGIVVLRGDGDKRIFGRVRRSMSGEVFVLWAEDESPENLSRGSNPHASYHRDGRLHAKTYDRANSVRKLQTPSGSFSGTQPLNATNADRALSPTLPALVRAFDDTFEIPVHLLTGQQSQAIAVDLVEPGAAPIRVTGRDRVVAEKVFRDAEPWIAVSLVEIPSNL